MLPKLPVKPRPTVVRHRGEHGLFMRAFNLVSRLALFIALFGVFSVAEAALSINAVTTVDVTPSSFSVIWETNEPSTPGIKIFSDAAGTNEITNQLEVTAFPLFAGDPQSTDKLANTTYISDLQAQARSLGLMKLRIDGASPNTTYYYRVSSATATETIEAPPGSTTAVTTASENSFISGSHQALVTMSVPDARGWLVTAETDVTQYPVSSYVGDGAAANQVFLNLSQLFQTSSSNWDPTGNHVLKITVRRGSSDTGLQNYDLAFNNQFVVSMLYQLQFSGAVPLITLLEPAQDRYTIGENIQITWTDNFPTAGANVALYYDTDNTGEDGVLIAGGIPEATDGAGDNFSWDTTGVADGIYYVYATVSDGITGETSYSTGRVAIDRAQVDSDSDTLADLWEQLYFGDLSQDGSGDADSDGSLNRDELAQLTNPVLPDVRLALSAGMNLISFPIELAPSRNSADLLSAFAGVVTSISRIDATGNVAETTEWNGGAITGPAFPIQANEGYQLQLSAATQAEFQGIAVSGAHDLVPGTNLAGFTSVPDGYDAYQLLQAIGTPDVVRSISQYNTETGRFETAVYDGTSVAGVNFPIVRGRAYLIGMSGTVNAFMP